MSEFSIDFVEKSKQLNNKLKNGKNLRNSSDFDREKLSEQKRKISQFQYPYDIDFRGDRNVILFDINVPSGSRFESDGGTLDNSNRPVIQQGGNSLRAKSKLSTRYKRTTTSIAMYMPDDISNSYTADWQSKELGLAGGISKVLSNFDSLLSTEGAKTILKATGEGVSNVTAGVIQQLTPLQLQDARNFGKAQISNPYLEVIFNGTENRPFNFNFKFTPRSPEEALQVKDIIEQFKYHHAPEFKYAENNLETYLLYPSTFDITFLHEGESNKWVHRISTCALRSININHNSEGGFRTFENGAPVTTNMSLEFIELELLTKDRIKAGF